VDKLNLTYSKKLRSLKKSDTFIGYVLKNKLLYLMLLPGLIQIILFKYWPMLFLSISFKHYSPYLGFFGSEWAGFEHFARFLGREEFWLLTKNTFTLTFLSLIFFFPIPIIVSLLLNEVKNKSFKFLTQTIIYIPHFISWPVVTSIAYIMLTTEGGIVNDLIVLLGGEKIPFLMSKDTFHGVYIGEVIWKETGYSTIIYLAAIAGIDLSLYESAVIDGAGRFKQMWHITLPSIRSTVIVLFILRLGHFLEAGFEQVYLLQNPLNRVVSQIYDTYVYEYGVKGGQYSYTTAIGVLTSLVGLVLVLGSNWLVKKTGEEGIL
jgi:putative aldouronate transport system permease protein